MMLSPEQIESTDLSEVKVATGGSRTVIVMGAEVNTQLPAAALVVTVYLTACPVVKFVGE